MNYLSRDNLKASFPGVTIQGASMSASLIKGTRDRIISATPPPSAVELTFMTRRHDPQALEADCQSLGLV